MSLNYYKYIIFAWYPLSFAKTKALYNIIYKERVIKHRMEILHKSIYEQKTEMLRIRSKRLASTHKF